MFENILRSSPRQTTVQWGEETYHLSGQHMGDVWMKILYPDIQQQLAECRVLAVNNGRSEPYDLETFSQALSIRETLKVPAGETVPDFDVLLKLFDHEPGLFLALANAAFFVLGLSSTERKPNGEPEWSQVLIAIRSAQSAHKRGPEGAREVSDQLAKARQVARTALDSYRREKPSVAEDDEDDEVTIPLMEEIEGKAPAVGLSPQSEGT